VVRWLLHSGLWNDIGNSIARLGRSTRRSSLRLWMLRCHPAGLAHARRSNGRAGCGAVGITASGAMLRFDPGWDGRVRLSLSGRNEIGGLVPRALPSAVMAEAFQAGRIGRRGLIGRMADWKGLIEAAVFTERGRRGCGRISRCWRRCKSR